MKIKSIKDLSIFKELKKSFSDLSLISSLSGKLFFITATTGIVVGFAAIVFNFTLDLMIEMFDHLISILPWPPLLIFIPAIGGLLAGLVRYFSRVSFESACATDAMIESIHEEDGHVDTRIPIFGILSSSLTIASGGSCGRECPTAYIGTGFASITARLIKRFKIDKLFGIKLTKRDERLMGICGAAAGVGAIFRAPIGAAVFSVEVLYRYGLEFTALFPALISATIGFTLFSLFYSYESLFTMEAVWEFGFSTILFAIIISIISSLIGWLYTHIFNQTFHYFRRLRLPDWLKPAIGGLIHGLLVFFVARELWGMGYETIQNAIDGRLTIVLMLILLFGKMFSTSFTIASGGSGGVIAPSLFIGAMLGGILGKAFMGVVTTGTPIGVYVAIGMVALYAAVGKVPFALPLLIMEATRNISLMLPLFIASTIGYILSGRNSIYEPQPTRIDYNEIGLNVLGETEGDIIASYEVKDVMSKDDSAIPQHATLKKIGNFIKESKVPFFPVVDNDHRLCGTISFSEIKYIFSPEGLNQLIVASDLATEVSDTITPQSSLKETLAMFYQSNLDYLPVVDSDDSNRFVGILAKNDVMELLKREMVNKVFKERR
ncbi:MAG: chloride channel protein [Thermodesulfobacteriota bacterium]